MRPSGGIRVRRLLLTRLEGVSENVSVIPELRWTGIPKEPEGKLDHQIYEGERSLLKLRT